MTTTTSNTNTPTEYFKCNFCNRKFAIPKPPKPLKTTVDDSSLNLKYERKYAKLLFDMHKHIDRHREERPNHKIPRPMLLNLFTRVVQDRQGKGRGGRPKGRRIARRKEGGPGDGSSDDNDATSPAATPVPTTTPKPR
jgi:hypothetical protein